MTATEGTMARSDQVMTGAEFEAAIRRDTIRRVVAMLRENLTLHHSRAFPIDSTPLGVFGVDADFGLRELRERLHGTKGPFVTGGVEFSVGETTSPGPPHVVRNVVVRGAAGREADEATALMAGGRRAAPCNATLHGQPCIRHAPRDKSWQNVWQHERADGTLWNDAAPGAKPHTEAS